MSDVFYLSDDLVISALTADKNTTADYPTSIDGFTAIIMMTGEATVSIDMQNYHVRPNAIVVFNPNSIIRTLFTTAFYIITEINQRDRPGELKQGRCEVLFNEFMSLLQQYNKRERNVSFYARQLNITPKYLSSVVKEVSGKTAARWIDESVILEAKTLLKYSGMSIQEIAYHLNFSTQSFFGKYFKQHTGTSPSRYKRKG